MFSALHKLYLILIVWMLIGNGLWAQTPIVYLPMNGNANDLSGNSINGTVNGAVLTTDRLGNLASAYEFDGSSSHIMLPYHALYNIPPGGQFTLSLWLLPYDANSISALLCKSEYKPSFYDSQWNFGLYLLNNKGMSGYANNNFLVGTTTMSANACWHHYAVTYNNGIWVMYVDGVIEATDFSQTKKISQSNSPIGLGRKGASSGDYFRGKLDEVRVYDVALTYEQIKSISTWAGIDQTICPGASVSLNGVGAGTPLWTPSSGLSNPNIYNPIANPAISTTYILSVTYGSCITRDTVLVTVQNLTANAGSDKVVCPSSSVQLNGSGSGSISWSPTAGLSNPAILNPMASPSVTTQYILTITQGSCIKRDTMLVTVSNPTADAGSNQSICPGASVMLYGVGTGTPLWTPASGLNNPNIFNPTASPATSTTYILTVSLGSCIARDTVLVDVTNTLVANAGPDRQICKRQVIQINGSGSGPNFSWLPIKNISNNLSATPLVNPDTFTTYILTVTSGTCIARDTVNIFVNPLDAQILTPDTFFCVGDTIVLRGYVFGFNYAWSPLTQIMDQNTLQAKVFPNGTTKYYLRINDATCDVVDSVTLTTITLSVDAGLDTLICAGETVQLQGEFFAGASYVWSPSTGLSNNQISNPLAAPVNTTDYRLQLKWGNHCYAYDSLRVTVLEYPLVQAGIDQRFCPGESVVLNGSVSNADAYFWSPAVGLNNTGILNPIASPTNVTPYILTANKGKCVHADTVVVGPNPPVIADFRANPQISVFPAWVQFTNLSLNAYFFQWDFDDLGSGSALENPTHTFNNIGVYHVTLIALDSIGCKDSSSLQITVTDDPRIYVPNVFTPDINQINDQFKVVYNEPAFERLSYSIFNRWGELIYHTSFPGGAWWDGIYKGKPCEGDVYFYLIDAKPNVGDHVILKGTFTLLR